MVKTIINLVSVTRDGLQLFCLEIKIVLQTGEKYFRFYTVKII